MSRLTRTRYALCLAVAGSLALAASAYAGPAGQEYLPKLPDAGGSQSGSGSGGGATQSSAAAPSAATGEPTDGASEEGGTGKERSRDKGAQGASATPAVATEPASDDDGSSGLLNPVVLLIVAGVIIAAVGMTLRHRAAGIEDTATDGGRSARDRGEAPSARPTPDGEIVAGGDQS
jgi:hypothetical protein